MNASYDKNAAIVILPPVSNGRLQNRKLRAWLAQSELSRDADGEELLARVVRELNLPYPEQGLAALRMWGQTGDRSNNWMAAADPVYLEPRLDHLCLHAQRARGIRPTELRALINHLQSTLAVDQQFGFMRLGYYGYLSSTNPVATAGVPDYVVDQRRPDEFLPDGDKATSYRSLTSEIEMALHEHEVNRAREASGQQPVNSLWLWGGGTAPEKVVRVQPPLFSDDPLLTGYWYSATGVAEPWPESISACIEASVAGFVAEIPEFVDQPALLEDCLLNLRDALRSRRLSSLTLLFRDGVRARVRRSNALRFWLRDSPLLAAPLT